MSDAVLTVSGLSKKYSQQLRRSLGYAVRDFARELWPGAVPHGRLRAGEFWALDDVSFEVKRGQALAIVGRNGAGKSTLLRTLFGLLKPDRGEIRINGRTEALIELGTGFNGLLSGRENIKVGASLHGFDSRQTARLIDEVIDFAELEEFIDVPIQSYSTGMRARLAYAVASHLKPHLLLVDEVLAVGDFSFQRKCINHMRAFLDRGGSLLLVSHNVYQIQAVCQDGLLLDHGRNTFTGTAVEAINKMYEIARNTNPPGVVARGSDDFAIEQVHAQSIQGGIPKTGEPMRVSIDYRAASERQICWGFGFWTEDEWVCVTGAYQEVPVTIAAGSGTLSCLVPRLPLAPGRYQLRATMVDPVTRYPLALYGWKGDSLSIAIGAEPNAVINGLTRLNQLTVLEAQWQ